MVLLSNGNCGRADYVGFDWSMAVFGGRASQRFANHRVLAAKPANDFANRPVHSLLSNVKGGPSMSGKAVLENVRRYRTIASLYRQTAAFRPDQKCSLLAQA